MALIGMPERETVVELPFAADCCPCVKDADVSGGSCNWLPCQEHGEDEGRAPQETDEQWGRRVHLRSVYQQIVTDNQVTTAIH
jgi:hypothetical protein